MQELDTAQIVGAVVAIAQVVVDDAHDARALLDRVIGGHAREDRDIGIAAAAQQQVIAAATGQRVVRLVAGQRVVRGVAGRAGGAGADQGEILDGLRPVRPASS